MNLRRVGSFLISLGISISVGLLFNPVITQTTAASRVSLSEGEVLYSKIYLLGTGHIVRILAPDGFNGSFILMSPDGRTEINRSLGGPLMIEVHPSRRGWHILSIRSFYDQSTDIAYEVTRMGDPDWSSILEALIISCAGLLIFLKYRE
jgi:hypothetical protein